MALVLWPARSGVQHGPLEGFGGFEAWQTAGLNAKQDIGVVLKPNAKKKLLMWTRCLGLRGQNAKRAFGGFWKVLDGLKRGKRQA